MPQPSTSSEIKARYGLTPGVTGRVARAAGRARLRAVATAITLAFVALFTLPAAASRAAAAPAPAASCCSVTVNGPAVTMTASKKGATVKKTFRGSVGQQVSEVLTSPVTSDQGCETLTLLNPSGAPVDDNSACGNGNAVGVGPDTLTVPGVYTVELQLDPKATGHGKLWVSATVSLGSAGENKAAEPMNVTRVGQGVERSFTGQAGQLATEVVTGVTTSDQGCETLTLLSPNGNTVDSNSACGNGNPVGVGPDKLTVKGKYTVLLQIDTIATGTSKLWVSIPVSRGTVTVNGPAGSVNVTRVGQGVERTFHGSAGQRVTSVVNGIATSDQGCETLTILGPSGNTVDDNSACGDGNPVTAGPDRLGKTGTYTALYQVDNTATGTGKLKITT
jgi:hypothetical protein